jgi:hypothetical protein
MATRRVNRPLCEEVMCPRPDKGISKKCYRSAAVARKSARLHNRKMYVYFHRVCGYWHLTHEAPHS